MGERDLAKAALRGEPSYVWRAGQERRLKMILEAAPAISGGRVLVDGCGVGMYLARLAESARCAHGLDIEFARLLDAQENAPDSPLVCGAGERLPYDDNGFDLVLSHEVIEHVSDDRAAVAEMVRVTRPGGRIVIFCPNRWYPFETHGIYWRGQYRFGNAPLVNYLPSGLRNRFAPHVRAYTGRGLRRLFEGLPVRIMKHTIIFGAYDNIIARAGLAGRLLRGLLQGIEATPLKVFGLSHLLVAAKT